MALKNWKPTATFEALRYRAQVMEQIRAFFKARDILEVETPLMAPYGVTDPHIAAITANFQHIGANIAERYYLQTSPEYAMKRLLVAGSGSIFQLCKAFRNGEIGRIHNPEFTLLEWYRLDFDGAALMQEVEALIRLVLPAISSRYYTYQSLFETYVGINPHTVSLEQLHQALSPYNINNLKTLDHDTLLQSLMAHAIEPQLPPHEVTFVTEFPASQAALARLKKDNPHVAERFEVYAGGVELANGFYELTDINEQRQRFEADTEKRKALGYPEVPIDPYFLAALTQGLPDCAGVALGIDRLIMLGWNTPQLAEVVSFVFEKP